MKITSVNNSQNSNKQSFKSIYTNNALKKTFQFAEENSALFSAITTVALSTIVRPLVILSTPKTEKENKKYAAIKSIASSIVGFSLMFLISIPIVKAIKKIDKNPERYLNKNTIKNLSEKNVNLKNSKAYIFSTQMFKLGTILGLSLPKAMLVGALITPIAKNIFDNKKKQKTKEVSFKGNIKKDFLSKTIAKIMNTEFMQKLAKKYKISNYEMTMMTSADILATAGFVYQNNKNKEMKKEHKKALNSNVIIGTGLSILSAFTIDKLLDKKTDKFIENFKKANSDLKDMPKYVEGIKITKKVFILGGIYYCVIPLLSTYFSDKSVNKIAK